jgi:hypothetical protein
MNTLNNRKDYSYIVSVESRKGGVGKTTAALCMSKLLLQKGWEVLFLDTDITGTNVTGVLESVFWRNNIHVVTYSENREKPIKVNLLEVFERGFMAGKGVPSFESTNRSGKSVFLWEKGKVNVIGSEIYSRQGSKLVCKPSILFDEIHAFWFVKCLREICFQFQETAGKNKRTAIVIDNSPGYVGIGPSIQEWLTDRGVDRSKLLFVTSLDEQDLTACIAGVEALHSNYYMKWKAAKKLTALQSKNQNKSKKSTTEFEGNEMPFAIRLLEGGDDTKEGHDLDFYLHRGLNLSSNKNQQLGDIFTKEIEKYQAIIVNKVPQRFKKGWWEYRIDRKDDQRERVYRLLIDEDHWGMLSSDIMVEYNEYVDNQFIEEHAIRIERDHRRNIDELKPIWERIRSTTRSLKVQKNNLKNRDAEFWKRLDGYQTIIEELLGQIAYVHSFVPNEFVREEL